MLKRLGLLALCALAILLYAGCGEPRVAATVVTQPPRQPVVQDTATLLTQLQAAHVSISQGGQVRETFLSVTGTTLIANGERVEVFEYATAAAANADAARIDPEACMVSTDKGTINLEWKDSPHFFKGGRVIVLYVGTTPQMRQLFTQMFGPQFAGK